MAGGQLRLVLLRQLRRLELVHGIPQPLRLLCEVARVARQRGPLVAQGDKLLPRRRVRFAADAPVGVEHVALEALVQEGLVVVGAMHVHEQAPEGAESLDCRCHIVHVHAAAACGGDRASHYEDAVLARRKASLVEKPVDLAQDGRDRRRGKVELGLDARLLRAVAHGRCVGARAEREL